MSLLPPLELHPQPLNVGGVFDNLRMFIRAQSAVLAGRLLLGTSKWTVGGRIELHANSWPNRGALAIFRCWHHGAHFQCARQWSREKDLWPAPAATILSHQNIGRRARCADVPPGAQGLIGWRQPPHSVSPSGGTQVRLLGARVCIWGTPNP